MNTIVSRLLPLTLLAGVAVAQNQDLLLTFSQPERTLSGSGGTVLQNLMPNEISHLQSSTMPCPVSAEKWAPRTSFHTMAGDENADGQLWNPALFGRIDALYASQLGTAAGGPTNGRTVFWSVSAPMGNNVSLLPLRPGDVGRIVRNAFGDGQVEYFMSQQQFNIALGLPPATPIDVDAIAFSPNFGVYFSLDVDIFAPALCGGTLVKDGDIVCVPPGALAFTPDMRIAGVAVASAVVVYTEAMVDAMVLAAGVTDRFGACIPLAIDTEALEIDMFAPAMPMVTCTGIALPVATLVFSTETMTGASLLTTQFGGQIYNTPCGPTGTACGFGPTWGPQLGIQAASTTTGAPSYVNGLAFARTFTHVLEAQQPVMNVFPFGAPAGANGIDYDTPWPFNFVFIDLAAMPVPGSLPAAPFSLLCFPDLYIPNLINLGLVPAQFGTMPTPAIPPGWSGKVVFQSIGLGGSGLELSTPAVVDVQ